MGCHQSAVEAAKAGCLDCVDRCIDDYPEDLGPRMLFHKPPMHYAIRGKHAHIVKYLLARGCQYLFQPAWPGGYLDRLIDTSNIGVLAFLLPILKDAGKYDSAWTAGCALNKPATLQFIVNFDRSTLTYDHDGKGVLIHAATFLDLPKSIEILQYEDCRLIDKRSSQWRQIPFSWCSSVDLEAVEMLVRLGSRAIVTKDDALNRTNTILANLSRRQNAQHAPLRHQVRVTVHFRETAADRLYLLVKSAEAQLRRQACLTPTQRT